MLTLKKKSRTLQLGFSIPVYIYPVTVLFSFRQDDEELARMLRDKGAPQSAIDAELAKWEDTVAGRYVFYKNGIGLVRMRDIPTTPAHISFLSHEIFHLVTHIMDYIGMPLEPSKSEEAYAYLVSYLTEEVFKLLEPHYVGYKEKKDAKEA